MCSDDEPGAGLVLAQKKAPMENLVRLTGALE
jgi:hypothetical protein